MKFWTSGFSVLFAHMRSAVMNGKGYIGKCRFHIGGLHPFIGIFRVVIIAVHRQAIAANKVVSAAIVVAVLRANIVPTDRSSKRRRIGNFRFVRIGAVTWVTNKI